MPTGCSILRNDTGEVEYVESPYNGERSNLYQQALAYTDDQEVAIDVWAAASTPSFQNEVYTPKQMEYRNFVNGQLDGFSREALPITTTEYQGGERVFTAKENGKIVGQIRTTPYRSGHRIVMSQINGVQGQGTGSALYKSVIQYSLDNKLDLYSDTNLSDAAEGMWNKLKRFAIAEEVEGGYVARSTPFDENQEPSLGEVLSFIQSTNEQLEFTDQEMVDTKVALTNTTYNTSEELYQDLLRAFYPNGVFQPTEASLRSINLYNESEIENIVGDAALQADIRDFIEKLKNLEDPILNDIPVDYDYIATSQVGINILGKAVMDNPYLNEKEALDVLAGIKDRREYQDALNDSNLEYLKTQGDKFTNFSAYNRVRDMEIDEQGNLTQKRSNTKEVLTETLQVPENTDLVDNILYLNTLSEDLWNSSPAEVKQVLKQVRSDAADIALDLDGLEGTYDGKTRAQVLSLLNTISGYIAEPSDARLQMMSDSLDQYFSLDTTPKERVIKVQPRSRDKSLVYLETQENAYNLFVNHGLLPLGDNAYQLVENQDNLEMMYINLYLNILENPQILPTRAYKSALEKVEVSQAALRESASDNRFERGFYTLFDTNAMTVTLDQSSIEETLDVVNRYTDNKLTSSATFNEMEYFAESVGILVDNNRLNYDLIAEETGVTQQDVEMLLSRVETRISQIRNVIPTYRYELNRSILNRPSNQDRVMQDIKNFIQSESKNIISGSTPRVTEDLERMYISAVYFNTKLNNERQAPGVLNEINEINDPVSNAEYLSTDFISDFRVQQVKAKQINSQEYQDYYSNLQVTAEGIEIINDDPISMLRMQPYITEEMQDYMRVHKYNFVSTDQQATDRIVDNTILRNYYRNYPEALPVFAGEYQILSNLSLTAKSQGDFIRLNNNKIYEAVASVGDHTFYGQIDTNPSNYKDYQTNTTRPELDIDISQYNNFTINDEIEVNINNKYNSAQEQEIDEQLTC